MNRCVPGIYRTVRNFNVSLQQIYCGPLSQEVKMFPICSG